MQADMVRDFTEAVVVAQRETERAIQADAEVSRVTTSLGGHVVRRAELASAGAGAGAYWAWWLLMEGTPPTYVHVPGHFGPPYVASFVRTRVPVLFELVWVAPDRVAAAGVNLHPDAVAGAYLVRGNFQEPAPQLEPQGIEIIDDSFVADGTRLELRMPALVGDFVVMLQSTLNIETRAAMPLAAPSTTVSPYAPLPYCVGFYRLFDAAPPGRFARTIPASAEEVTEFLHYASPWQTVSVIRPRMWDV
jgi:hypothetical protein